MTLSYIQSNKNFFQRCIMKKFAIFCLILCIAGSAFGFVGCGNDHDVSSELDRLRTELADIRDDAEETANALTSRITSLETQLAAANEEIASLRTEVTRLTELSSTLSRTITELTNIVKNEASGNEALKAKLDTLQAQYEQTKAAVDSLSAKVSSLESNIGSLQSELDEANSRIDILESVAGQEPPVLNMGYTFVLKSPTGIEMLKFKPVEYRASGSGNNIGYFLDFNIQRLNIPNSVPIDSYFTFSVYSERLNEYFYKSTNLDSVYEDIGDDFSKLYGSSFINNSLPPEDVTYIIIGLPSDNNLNDNQEKKYIIPYAIYML